MPLVALDPAEELAAVILSPSGRWLAMSMLGGTLGTTSLRELGSKDSVAVSIVPPDQSEMIYASAFSDNDHWFATASRNLAVPYQALRLWDIAGRNPITSTVTLRVDWDEVAALRVSSNGYWLATSNYTGTMNLWNLSETDRVKPLLTVDADGLDAFDFSSDSRWLAVGGQWGSVRLWDLTLSDPAATSLSLPDPPPQSAGFVRFSPDSRWLAAGTSPRSRYGSFAGQDTTARVWDLATGSPPLHPIVLHGHEGEVDALAFSSDSRWLATGSGGGTVRVWDLAASDPAADSVILNQPDGVEALAFSPDSHWLAAGSSYNPVRLWNLHLDELITLACRMAGRNWTPEEWARYVGNIPYQKICPNLPQ